MKNKITKGSHFVWERQLKEFSNAGRLYVYDKKTGKIFRSNTENVAKKNNIYEFKDSFTDLDIKVSEGLIDQTPFVKELLKRVLHDLICFLENNPKPLLKSLGIQDNQLSTLNQLELIHYTDNQERLYTFYENNFLPLFERLLKKDKSFYFFSEDITYDQISYVLAYYYKMSIFLESKILLFLANIHHPPLFFKDLRKKIKEYTSQVEKRCDMELLPEIQQSIFKFNFLQFLLTQYFRTEKHYHEIDERIRSLPINANQHIKKNILMAIGSHILSLNVALVCLSDKNHIVFLQNCGKLNFITSDQPIINTLADKISNGETQIELYYPLSPKLALLYTPWNKYKNDDLINCFDYEIASYNTMIYKESKRFVYSKHKEDLWTIQENIISS